MKRFWTNNSLSIVLFSIFAITLIGMSIAGWKAENNELEDRNQPTQSYSEYIVSGTFIEGVFENWESEFLQMFALVVLTVFLRQKGADDSKPIRGKMEQDTTSRYSIIKSKEWSKKVRAAGHHLYAHSLSLALLLIFFISFALHAIGGVEKYNEDARYYGSEEVSALQYIGTSQFWYESFQNWQSEFLAVGSLLLLSIYLRERGSPESKPVGKSHNNQTGI
jgi:hypothetical protein